jgi:hypothetical protein
MKYISTPFFQNLEDDVFSEKETFSEFDDVFSLLNTIDFQASTEITQRVMGFLSAYYVFEPTKDSISAVEILIN